MKRTYSSIIINALLALALIHAPSRAGEAREPVQVAALAGPVGYFLLGGSLSSDGLRDDRWLDRDNIYAKLSTPLPGQITLTANHTYVSFRPDSGPDPGATSFSNLIFDYEGPWGAQRPALRQLHLAQ